MKFDVAIALRRTQRRWTNKRLEWDDLVERFANTQRTSETLREYLRAPKTLQASIKDVGGFVGGYLNGGSRSSTSVRHRQIITLDIDESKYSMEAGLVSIITDNIPYELVIYSTHKHTSEKPRLRVIIPLDRPCSVEEYEAVARFLAGEVGIDNFDPTTFQPSRFMYWPSTSSDGEFFFHHESLASICEVDEILNQYVDWRDITAWPRLSTEEPAIVKESKKLGEPTEKDGIVGAWCRAYDVEASIEEFLSSVYALDEATKRYTFLDGESAGGGIVYNRGTFFYSHHASDPAGGRLLNSFDLVRIHKFGGLDVDDSKPMSKKESFLAMCDFALQYSNVKAELDDVDRPISESLYLEFSDELVDDDWMGADISGDPDSLFNGETSIVNINNIPDFYKPEYRDELPGGINKDNWKDKLTRTKKGDVEATIANVKLIIIFDKDLTHKLAFNEFDNTIAVTGPLPWNASKELRTWEDADADGLMDLVETKYGIYAVTKTLSALVLASRFNKFHPVRTFLDNLTWDGVPRLDTLFIDYMGATDDAYTRAVTRKAFTAAVARVYKPGCKFDYTLTLVGREGLRKSTIINEMAGRWFSDSFHTVEGTKGYEQLQGSWLIEIGELSAFNRSEITAVKKFLSAKKDKFRAAYTKNTKDVLRQCVFFATTNEFSFLKGLTGNRRFWPVLCTKKFTGVPVAEKSAVGSEVIMGIPVQQLWAEAKHYFEKGEKLYLSDALEKIAFETQEKFTEEDPRLGQIKYFLDMKVPEAWFTTMSKFEKRSFLSAPDSSPEYGDPAVQLDQVCALDIWVYALGMEPKDMSKYHVKDINDLMRKISGWSYKDHAKTIQPWGLQRYFKRDGVEEVIDGRG